MKSIKNLPVLLCVILLFACDKQPDDIVYDSHLFQSLQAHVWIFDSGRNLTVDTVILVADTIEQTAEFKSQQYIIRRTFDTTLLDTTAYQAIYDNPDKVYYYLPGGQLIPNQFFVIDTVNDSRLTINQTDTANSVSVIYYHAK